MGTRRTRTAQRAAGPVDGPPSAAAIAAHRSQLPKTLKGLIRATNDPLKEFARSVDGGKRAIMGLLEASTHDPAAVRLVAARNELKRTTVGAHDSNISLRDIVDAADMHDRDFVATVHRCMWDFQLERARLKYAQRYADMMEVSLNRAMEPDATREREIHFQASGHLPTAKGIQIGIQQTANFSREPDEGEAPSVSRTVRRIVRDLPPADV